MSAFSFDLTEPKWPKLELEDFGPNLPDWIYSRPTSGEPLRAKPLQSMLALKFQRGAAT